MLRVSILAVVVVIGTITIKYNSSVKERNAVQIAKEYLAQKYKQKMIYESVRLPQVDPVLYYVSFTSENTGIKFNVHVSPRLLKFPEEKTNTNFLWDDYLSSFFCRKTEETVLPEIKEIWDDNANMRVNLQPSNAYPDKKNSSDINEHMTEREVEPFYNYRFYVTTNRVLNSESRTEEAMRILNLFQAIHNLDYNPVEILVWYQTGTIERGKEIEKYINFVSGSIPSQPEKLETWLEIVDIEDIIRVMDEQWFSN